MNGLRPPRVAFVDRHDLFADCLGLVLDTHEFRCQRLVVPHQAAGRSDQLTSRLLALRPDVALINSDLGMGLDALTLVESVSSVGVPVVVLHDSADDVQWGCYLAAGARTVVPKTAGLASLLAVVRRVSKGQGVLGPVERERLMTLSDAHAAEALMARRRVQLLSAQEGAALRALMVGLTASQIAADRVVSVATVRTQVKAVLAKLEVSSQLSAVALAHRAGWSPFPTLPPTTSPPRPGSASGGTPT